MLYREKARNTNEAFQALQEQCFLLEKGTPFAGLCLYILGGIFLMHKKKIKLHEKLNKQKKHKKHISAPLVLSCAINLPCISRADTQSSLPCRPALMSAVKPRGSLTSVSTPE